MKKPVRELKTPRYRFDSTINVKTPLDIVESPKPTIAPYVNERKGRVFISYKEIPTKPRFTFLDGLLHAMLGVCAITIAILYAVIWISH